MTWSRAAASTASCSGGPTKSSRDGLNWKTNGDPRRMTIQIPPEMIETRDRYELYRVITDLESLHEGFRDRVEDLQITRLEIDAAGEMQSGYSAKLLCDPPMRSFGDKSLPRMLKATGMALVLVIDDERFAVVKERLALRRRPARSIVRSKRPAWLFTRSKSLKMLAKRWSEVSPETRKKMARKMGKASGKSRRAKARKSVGATV